ncbi:FecR family protein [Maribellus maritimus]|uniref:FecR family protein n=1 Tax=Maribellus maritimus TaxID=2870838 RepID=UPI001EEA1843|nr:FecR family protein [Maribellus maritimus]MCG6186827.1 FecR family protein [Maribellus maritimus]
MNADIQNIDDFLANDEFNEYVLHNSEKQKKKWTLFFKEHPELEEEAIRARKIIKELYSLKDTTSNKEINEFRLQRNYEDIWKKYKNIKSKSTILFASKWIWKSVAAASVVVIAISFYWLMNNYVGSKYKSQEFSEIYVPASEKSQIKLPDGSMVWLNSQTKIKYSSEFNKDERILFLSGEAYFEVTSNKKIPFLVVTDKAEVQVVGTKFNVKAYSNEDKVETALVEGKIKFIGVGAEHPIELKPGDKAVYNPDTQKLIVTEEDVNAEAAWKDGKIVFRNSPLSEVCKTLERRYDVKIVIEDTNGNLNSHPFTFTIEGEDIQHIFTYLGKAAPIKFVSQKEQNKIKYLIYPLD